MLKISCIIPSYNYAEHIESAVQSALAALHQKDELIVIDDGSTDDSRSRLDHFIKEKKIQYFYQENTGVSAARNAGMRHANGDYLYFLDADDRTIKSGLEKLRNMVDESGIALVIGGHISISHDKRREHRQKQMSSSTENNFTDYVIRRRFSIANGGTALVRKDIALRYPYPESLKVSEDFCVYAWILANEQVSSIPEPIVEVVKHDDSLRNQSGDYAETVRRLPDVVFDVNKLPASLLKWKQQFACNRLLSLFRIQYLAGDYSLCKKTYHNALRCHPLNLFRISYLRKYLKASFR